MGASSLIEAAQNIGKYTLIEKIGEGYLGPVYRGFDQDLGKPVVVRILCDGIRWDSQLEEVFKREIMRVAALQHSNIAKILDFGREGQTHYIVMESLGSGTLESLIAQNSAIPVEKKLSIMIQISEGLSHAHKNGILHRDLVPGKIHLTPDGNAKVRDFAIAHILMKYLPHPVVRWGVPIYLCPEQIQHKECDARSDIFSIGTIFYELLTHFHPFHDRDSNKALDNILSDAAIPTFEKFPDAPPGIWTILRSCLAKNPEDRYQSADELSQACRELLVSLAEDTQLVLAELYAALPALKKAAAHRNAAAGTRGLLKEIQSLLRGERDTDYAYLDRLMTVLMEQYPAIQAAANAPPALDSICPQLPPEETETPTVSGTISVQESAAAREPSALAHTAEPIPLPVPDPEVTAPLFGSGPEARPVPLREDSLDLSTPPMESGDSIGMDGIQPAVSLPQAEAETKPSGDAVPSPIPQQDASPREMAEPEQVSGPVSPPRYRRIKRPSYRSAAMLLAILVIVAAGYIAIGTDAAASIRKSWNIRLPYPDSLLQTLIPHYWSQSASKGANSAGAQSTKEKANQNLSEVLLMEARALAAENRLEESKVILRRVLETNPTYEPALAALRQFEGQATPARRSLEESVSQISALLNSGKLQLAKNEIDRLQQVYPEATEISGLRKRWQALSSKQAQEKNRKEEDQQKTLLNQKEDEWTRQLAEFFARGRYGEASGALALWMTENPASAKAQELNTRLQEIQHQLKTYSSAMAENKYQEALNALGAAERLNPTDSNFAEMRRQTEARKAAARASLTVHRLGAKANLLLDGRPVGKDGELENEAIAIGSHTLAIENGGGLIASRIQEYSEGQRVVLVYDLVKQNLRPMTDADRDVLSQRKAMEDVERFSLEHDHGVFRGSCRGMLSLNFLDIAYSPSSGSHGFRIPFKLLKLKTDGKTVSLYYISDNSHFQTFRFQDSQSADKFRQKWEELKSILR